ncbi:hypothetical protein Tco_0367435 [Tanacetum coccineum]
MTQGPGASRTIPQKRKQPKPKKTHVGSHSPLDEGTRKSQPLYESKTTNPKDLEGNNQPADKGLPSTFPDEDIRTDAKYQVDQTQSSRFEVSIPDQHQSKTSYEVDEDDVFEAGEEMDEYIQELDTEETQTHPSTEHTTEEHQSPSSNRDRPESSKAKKTKASDSESSSYFINTSFTKYDNTDAALGNFQQILNLFNVDHNTCLKRILDNLKEVQDAFKEDTALNKKVLEAIEAYTKNSTNLTKVLTLAKNFNFSGLKSLVETLKSVVDAQNDHLATWAKFSVPLKDRPLPQAECPQQRLLSLKVQQLLGENFAHTSTKEPPSYIEGEKADMDTKEADEK